MSDAFTKEKRSWVMSRIRSKDTNPEIIVRSLLHREGYRFRLHCRKIEGTPDIVLKKYNTLIFVHGCFWHQHRRCKRAVLPKTNKEYWLPKLDRNIKRFREVQKEVRRKGWKVIVVWECETLLPVRLLGYLKSRMGREAAIG